MTDNWDDEDKEEIIYVSKSELKRDMDELKALGKELIDMPLGKLSKIPLNEEQQAAVTLGRKIRDKKDAFRRHLQHVARILNYSDLEPIHLALEKIKQGPLLANIYAQKLEKIRENLIEHGDSEIQALIEQYPELDRSKLRQLVRQAKKHTDPSKPNKAAKQIFDYLKQSIPMD
jgi:ribosome-associated protein